MRSNTEVAPAVRQRLTSLSLTVAVEPQLSRIEREVIALFDRYRTPLLRYLISMRIPPAEGEEIVQDVFLLLYRHFQQGKPETNLAGWLFGTAHRQALKHRTVRKRTDGWNGESNIAGAPDRCSPDPEERLQMIDRRERLLAAVDALPERDRQCLSLRVEGLRYREIARILGMSLGSVAGSLARVLARLTRVAEL